MGLPTARQLKNVEHTCWRSLELHKHHRPLGLATCPTGSRRAADIAISRASQCSCHYERKCRFSQPCIEGISVDEVIAATERRVAARG